jgi:hypothetical protein
MRTRAFIGLILLVAAMMVATIPALLTPASGGIERVLVLAGLLDDPEYEAAKERKRDAEQSSDEQVDGRLELKGFEVTEEGDLRDTTPVGERDANQRGRLETGSRRTLLPGQAASTDAYDAPLTDPENLLLDANGCPMFRPGTDVPALLNDPETNQRYADRAASADDPADCALVLQARVDAATAAAEATDELPGTRRQRGSLRRGGLHAQVIVLTELQMLGSLIDARDLQAGLDAIE